MVLTPEGLAIVFVGYIPPKTLAAAKKALRSMGATLQRETNSKTQLMIVGEDPNPHDVGLARARSILLLDLDQLLLLLQDGEIELSTPHLPPLSLEEGIGALRAALDGAPSSESWSRIVRTLDRCVPQRLEDIVTYVETGLSRWDDVEMGPWTPLAPEGPLEHEFLEVASTAWANHMPPHELRVAPPLWIREMMSGVHSPKHRVVRALNLESMYAEASMIKRMLACEHLVNVRLLNLGRFHNKTSQTLFKKLRRAQSMRSLEELWMTKPTVEEAACLDGETTMGSLRIVRFQHYTGDVSEEPWRVLFDTTTFAQVETIASVWGIPRLGYAAMARRPPPRLRRLELHTYDEELQGILDSGVCASVEALALFGPTATPELLATLLRHPGIEALDVVDLSALMSEDEVSVVDSLAPLLEEYGERLGVLDRLVLGPHATPCVLEALEGVDVEVS